MTKKCEINECIFCELDSTKICDNCGECMFCDLDPTKICDNCGKCIDMGDYYTIKIDKIETNEKTFFRKMRETQSACQGRTIN